MMSFGGQVVTFVTIGRGGQGRFERERSRTKVDVPGCHFRPLATKEVISETDIATETWKCTAPPAPAAVDAHVTGELEFAGKTYLITGVQPKYDMDGSVHHVTVIAERQVS